ncbi:MAG TPA: hypothetical protein VIZ18_09140 [Ktedonobacteraceae bacterium]
MANNERKIAIDEIGEATVKHAEYLDSLTPERIAARDAAMAVPTPPSAMEQIFGEVV